MEYTHLGRTGLTVSRLCLGTMNFGPLTSVEESLAIMDRAHDLGINFFDTANGYGSAEGPPGQVGGSSEAHAGWTEEILGEWFASGGGRRERTVLATKVYGAMGAWPNDGKLSAPEYPSGLRGVAAEVANRSHRPLPDAPHRPGHAMG